MPINISNIHNSRVLVRVVYDIPNSSSFARIDDSLDTIKTLLLQNNIVILMTHWGRPVGVDDQYTTQKIVSLVQERLYTHKELHDISVEYINQYENSTQEIIKSTSAPNTVYLLENTRFHPNEKAHEEQERTALAQELYAPLASYFVHEAFPVSHRKEATVTELASLVPYCHGLAYTNEQKSISKLLEFGEKTLYIMGGAKLETKLPLLSQILSHGYSVFVAGKLVFPFLASQGLLQESCSNIEDIAHAQELLDTYATQIILPTDFVYAEKGDCPIDIGEQSFENLTSAISSDMYSAVFWNGPLGWYENKVGAMHTIQLADWLSQRQDTYVVIGGGDTASVLTSDQVKGIDFVSMGGGATLHYLAQQMGS